MGGISRPTTAVRRTPACLSNSAGWSRRCFAMIVDLPCPDSPQTSRLGLATPPGWPICSRMRSRTSRHRGYSVKRRAWILAIRSSGDKAITSSAEGPRCPCGSVIPVLGFVVGQHQGSVLVAAPGTAFVRNDPVLARDRPPLIARSDRQSRPCPPDPFQPRPPAPAAGFLHHPPARQHHVENHAFIDTGPALTAQGACCRAKFPLGNGRTPKVPVRHLDVLAGHTPDKNLRQVGRIVVDRDFLLVVKKRRQRI